MTHFKMTMDNRVWSLICRNIFLHTFTHVFRGIECLLLSLKRRQVNMEIQNHIRMNCWAFRKTWTVTWVAILLCKTMSVRTSVTRELKHLISKFMSNLEYVGETVDSNNKRTPRSQQFQQSIMIVLVEKQKQY